MRKYLALPLTALLPLSVAVEGCSSSLKCGDGTVEKSGECIVKPSSDGGGGMGGQSGSVSSDFKGVLSAGPASKSSLLVTWLASASDDVTYNIYVATKSGGYNLAVPQETAPAGSSSIEVTGLDAGTTYFVAVYAVVDGEVVPNKAEVQAVPSEDSKAPSFVGAKSAASADGSSVKLSWAEGDDELSPPGALVYLVYVGLSDQTIDLDVPIAVSEPGATSVIAKLPAPDTEYFFVVRVRDAAGNIDDNAKVVKATSGPDVAAPRFSGCSSVTAKSASQLAVTWDAAVDDTSFSDQLKYNVYVATTPDGHNFAAPDAVIKGATSGLVEGLQKATKYYVVCRAEDVAGNIDENTRLQSATTKSDGEPPVFAGLTATQNVGSTTVDLVWDAATDNQTKQSEIIYDVFAALTSGGQDFSAPPLASSEPGATSLTLTGLTSRKTNYVVVLARDAAQNLSETIVEKSFTTKVSLLKDIEIPIFSVKCALSSCHTGLTPQAGLNLDPGGSWGFLVNVQATSFPAETRVIPNDVANSHLMKRVKSTGQPGEPAKMPLSQDSLTPEQITTLEAWINEGALKN